MRVERSRTDGVTERLHGALKFRSSRVSGFVQQSQHIGVIEHVQQRSVRVGEQRSCEDACDVQLPSSLGKSRKVGNHRCVSLGRR